MTCKEYTINPCASCRGTITDCALKNWIDFIEDNGFYESTKAARNNLQKYYFTAAIKAHFPKYEKLLPLI